MITQPRLDALRSRFKTALDQMGHGAQTRTAEWLAAEYGGSTATHRVRIANFLEGRDGLSGEYALALADHLTATRTAKPTTARRHGRKADA